MNASPGVLRHVSAQAGDMNSARRAARQNGIVVIGAGQAGGRMVEALRRHGFTGRLTLVGDEMHPPYERPSLSKEMLLDASSQPVTWVHAQDYLAEQGVAFQPGLAATRIDRAAKTVRLGDGSELEYGVLVLATGARPRRLGIPGSGDCLYVRSLTDSRLLSARLQPAKRVLIIGAGFIGLEVAAAAVQRGCTVTVVETASRAMSRVAPAELGRYY